MNNLSIFLISNNLTLTANVSCAIGRYLENYRLAIIKQLADALGDPAPTHVILLDTDQLFPHGLHNLPPLRQAYPRAHIILLQNPHTAQLSELDLLEALNMDADDFVLLSETGLLTLGRRLAAHRSQSEVSAQMFDEILRHADSPLAIQLIGSDDRALVWSSLMEQYTGLRARDVLGRPIKTLSLPPNNLSRLKDLVDQARLTGAPFTVPSIPMQDKTGQRRWGRVYVYPLVNSHASPAPVCIIRTDITDLSRQNQHLQTLLDISREISSHLNLESALEQIVTHAQILLNADGCQVYLLDKDESALRLVHVGEEDVALPGDFLSVTDPVLQNYVDGNSGPAIHLMSAPLTVGAEFVGLVTVHRHCDHSSFTHTELDFLVKLTQQISAAVSNIRLFEETQLHFRELSIFYEASAAISTTWNTQEVLNTLIRHMVHGMDVSGGCIINLDKTQQVGTVQALYLSPNIESVVDGKDIPRTVPLNLHPTLLDMISKQRPVYLQLDNIRLDETERDYMYRLGCKSRLMVPMVVKHETIGWAELWDTGQERTFTPDEIRFVRILGNQAAVNLENVRYLNQMQQTLEETTALYEVSRALTATQDTHTIMSTVLKEYLRALNLPRGSVVIFNFDAKIGEVKVSVEDESLTTGPVEMPPDHAEILGEREGIQIKLSNDFLYAELMRTRQPVVIDADDSLVKQGWCKTDTATILAIPIRILGDIQGALITESVRHQYSFNTRSVSLGQAMADQLSVALQNAHLYELEYQRRQQAETLREVSFAVGSSLNLKEVLERILDQLGRVVKYDSAAIHIIQGKRRRVIAARGFSDLERIIGVSFPAELDKNEPGSVVIHNRQPLVMGNISSLYPIFTKEPHSHIKSWIGVPLIARGKVIGLITIDHTLADAYNEGDVNLTMAFANQVAIAVENARLYDLEIGQYERELEIAQRIQQTLLPQTTPQMPGLDIYGRVQPARQIGGDFFHYFLPQADKFGVAVGDVSGKGIPAAMFMAVATTAIDAQISQSAGPGNLLNNLQLVLYNRLQENKMNMGLQVALFSLAPAQSITMTLASAGMISPIMTSENGSKLLLVGGLPLGSPVENLVYRETEIFLTPGTSIIFTSDGIVEARNSAGELFGFERLETTVNEIARAGQSKFIADYIINQAIEFTGTAEQNDDMTVVVIRIK